MKAIDIFIETLETNLNSNGKCSFDLVGKTTIAHIKLAKKLRDIEKANISPAQEEQGREKAKEE